jgi:hypothetical protein
METLSKIEVPKITIYKVIHTNLSRKLHPRPNFSLGGPNCAICLTTNESTGKVKCFFCNEKPTKIFSLSNIKRPEFEEFRNWTFDSFVYLPHAKVPLNDQGLGSIMSWDQFEDQFMKLINTHKILWLPSIIDNYNM